MAKLEPANRKQAVRALTRLTGALQRLAAPGDLQPCFQHVARYLGPLLEALASSLPSFDFEEWYREWESAGDSRRARLRSAPLPQALDHRINARFCVVIEVFQGRFGLAEFFAMTHLDGWSPRTQEGPRLFIESFIVPLIEDVEDFLDVPPALLSLPTANFVDDDDWPTHGALLDEIVWPAPRPLPELLAYGEAEAPRAAFTSGDVVSLSFPATGVWLWEDGADASIRIGDELEYVERASREVALILDLIANRYGFRNPSWSPIRLSRRETGSLALLLEATRREGWLEPGERGYGATPAAKRKNMSTLRTALKSHDVIREKPRTRPKEFRFVPPTDGGFLVVWPAS